MTTPALTALLREFRLPTIASLWEESLARAEREDWGCQRLRRHLCQSEAQDRRERKLTRRLKDSGLPEGKTLGSVDEHLWAAKTRRALPALLEGPFVGRADNVIALGLPGRGKTHLLAGVGREWILRHGRSVLFVSTFKLVQRLLAAKKALKLEAELRRLGRYSAIIIDEFGYVQQDREEMEVLFTFLAERYERKSVLISSNLVFSQWDQIFKDAMTTMAAVDRLVHHATILEFTGESIRAQKAQKSKPE
jgi:DNA replication protein DnaC